MTTGIEYTTMICHTTILYFLFVLLYPGVNGLAQDRFSILLLLEIAPMIHPDDAVGRHPGAVCIIPVAGSLVVSAADGSLSGRAHVVRDESRESLGWSPRLSTLAPVRPRPLASETASTPVRVAPSLVSSHDLSTTPLAGVLLVLLAALTLLAARSMGGLQFYGGSFSCPPPTHPERLQLRNV